MYKTWTRQSNLSLGWSIVWKLFANFLSFPHHSRTFNLVGFYFSWQLWRFLRHPTSAATLITSFAFASDNFQESLVIHDEKQGRANSCQANYSAEVEENGQSDAAISLDESLRDGFNIIIFFLIFSPPLTHC